jgi:hypothetical protein
MYQPLKTFPMCEYFSAIFTHDKIVGNDSNLWFSFLGGGGVVVAGLDITP